MRRLRVVLVVGVAMVAAIGLAPAGRAGVIKLSDGSSAAESE